MLVHVQTKLEGVGRLTQQTLPEAVKLSPTAAGDTVDEADVAGVAMGPHASWWGIIMRAKYTSTELQGGTAIMAAMVVCMKTSIDWAGEGACACSTGLVPVKTCLSGIVSRHARVHVERHACVGE